ncbi:MAG: 5-oxoprolinase subunit PxpB [Deltaproteobacteria bacterium]|nr:5-oxoprolinase subunit PxpB [Deltaproteobacteria bacterium]
MTPIYRTMGDRSLLVELGEEISPTTNALVQDLMQRLESAAIPGIRELVPAYRSLLVTYNPLVISSAALQSRITAVAGDTRRLSAPASKLVTVPVVYGVAGGPDLESVAAHLRIDAEEIIRLHTRTIYRVYMIGFMPGFPYMGELPAALAMQRRRTPRTRVAKGSVGIAQRQTGIYPVDSPGGWQIIGWTPIELFDPHRRPPSLLEMGDTVKFEAVRPEEVKTWRP